MRSRTEHLPARIIAAPATLQRLTTKEPDDEMLGAIIAMEAVLPKEESDAKW